MKSIANFKLAPLAATMGLMISPCKASTDPYMYSSRYADPYNPTGQQPGAPVEQNSDIAPSGEASHTMSDTSEVFDHSEGEEYQNCPECGTLQFHQKVDGEWHWVHLVPATAALADCPSFKDKQHKRIEIKAKQARERADRIEAEERRARANANAARTRKTKTHRKEENETKESELEVPDEINHPQTRQVSAKELVADLNDFDKKHPAKTNRERFKLMREFFQSKYCQVTECAATSVACCLPVTVLYNGAMFCEKGGRAFARACDGHNDACCDEGECGFKDTRDTKCAGATAACSFGVEHCVNNEQRNKGHDELVDCFVAAWDDVKSRYQKNFVAPCETNQSGPKKTCEVIKNTLKCIFCPLTSTWYYGCNWGCCEDKPGNDFQNITNPICCKKELLENGQLESDCSILARETGPCVARTSDSLWKAVKKCVGTTAKCGFHCVKNGITGTYDKIVTCPCKTGQFFKESCAEGASQFCCICCNKCDTRIQRETGKDNCDKGCKCFFKETCGWCWCCCQVTLETGETMEGCMALCELIGCLARFFPSS